MLLNYLKKIYTSMATPRKRPAFGSIIFQHFGEVNFLVQQRLVAEGFSATELARTDFRSVNVCFGS